MRISDWSSDVCSSDLCFVSLYGGDGDLRGCIGSLAAERPLAEEAARIAADAAFRDPRFAPLSAAELAGFRLEISVLTPLLPLPAGSRAELLAALVPGHDGLLLRAGRHHRSEEHTSE